LRVAALAQLNMLVGDIVQPLLDLIEDIGAGAALVLVAQFEDHLTESPDRPNGVIGIVLADGMRVSRREPGFIVAWQPARLSVSQ
jgi:hypothetical protein